MAGIGVSEAARLVGRDVSTLHRMMKAGRLSYTIDSQGHRRLDPAELGRVFDQDAMHGNGAVQRSALPHGDSGEIVALLREAVQCRDAMLEDLRQRLDASETERRQLSERLHGLLTARVVEPPSKPLDGDPERLEPTGVGQSLRGGEDPPASIPEAPGMTPGVSSPHGRGLIDLHVPWRRRWFRWG